MRLLSASDLARDGRAINSNGLAPLYWLSSLAGRERYTILIIRQNYLSDRLTQIRKKWSGKKCSNKVVREVGTQKTEASKRERVLKRESAT